LFRITPVKLIVLGERFFSGSEVEELDDGKLYSQLAVIRKGTWLGGWRRPLYSGTVCFSFFLLSCHFLFFLCTVGGSSLGSMAFYLIQQSVDIGVWGLGGD